ncbi:MAG: hypothetical protein ACLU3I_02475 [Acutalibacteraceae bacterium]
MPGRQRCSDENGEEVDLKDDDDDDSIYGAGGKALPDDEITMDDDLPNGKDVDADEAAKQALRSRTRTTSSAC